MQDALVLAGVLSELMIDAAHMSNELVGVYRQFVPTQCMRLRVQYVYTLFALFLVYDFISCGVEFHVPSCMLWYLGACIECQPFTDCRAALFERSSCVVFCTGITTSSILLLKRFVPSGCRHFVCVKTFN